MKSMFVEAAAVLGPGLPDWEEGAAVLRNPAAYVAQDIPPEGSSSLSPNERRRTTPLIRLALRVVDQLARSSSLDLSKAVSVFASSDGDLQVIDGVCWALSLPGQPVSPMQFHNIVHNAPAGYWSLGARARAPSTSLTGRYATVSSGLLEAFTLLATGSSPVLFACCDHPGPYRVDKYRPRLAPFAIALALTPEPTRNYLCALRPSIVGETLETKMSVDELEALRRGNPTARALPLLRAIAMGTESRVVLSYVGQSSLAVDVIPARQNATEGAVDALAAH
jgi:hypothetical protein